MFFIFSGTIIVLITLIYYPRAFTQEIHVSPFIYDVQHKDYVTIHIKGLASTFDMIKWTNCNIMDLESRILMKANLTYDDSSVLARFYTPSSLGAFKVQCSKYATQLNFDGNFLLVNSLYLLIQNVEPSTISLGESVSLKLEVFNLTEPVPLLCHLSDNDDYVVLPTNSINGNKLSTWITCPEHQFTKAAEYRVTVVYSVDAIESVLNMNNFKMIAVHASRPKLIKSGYTKDLRTLWFQFDQNVEGPESCNEIFTHNTLTQLGYDAICWFSSDHLTVLLGNITEIKDNQFIIQFSANNAIRSYRSWPQYSSAMLSHEIIVPIAASEVTLPRYWLHGPRYYCGSPKNNSNYVDDPAKFTIEDSKCLGQKMISAFSMSSLLLKYNTILSVNDYSNSAMMSPEEASQRNIILRNSVKDIVKAVKRQNLGTGICLNSNMMLPNVMYTLEITGTNILYQSGSKTQLQFKLAETQNFKAELNLQIITRPSYATGTEAVFETMLYLTCDELDNNLYNNLQYDWYIVADGIKRNIIGINAPTLILDTKELTHNYYNYTVGCDLRGEIKFNNIKEPVIAKDEIKFGIEPFDAKAIIIPQQLVISFGRSIRLKVTHRDFSRKENIQYKWLCKTIKGDDCLMVGNYPELKAAFDQTGSSELTIREVTLQPGRYYVVVQISLSGVPIDSAVSVLVVSYESGPHISFYWPNKNFNPSVPFSAGKSFSIAATVSYLISGCLATWSTSADTGYTYLTSKQMGGKVKILEEFTPSRNKTFSRNVRLTMTLPNNVKYNTNYLIKLSILCDSLKHPIFGIIPISIIASPMISELKVEPIEGIGLTTVFRFQTIPAYDTKSSHPIQYSFGYYVPSLLSRPIYFYSSSYWLKTEYILPSVNSSTTRIKTVLRACNMYKSCSITEGPDVIIYQPTQISNSDLTKYSSKFKSLLELQMVGESEAYLFSITGTLRLYEHSKYQQFTEKISDVIEEFINDNLIKSLSHRTEYLPISLTYMESFTRTLPTLFKFNNIVLQSLLLLRDTIYTILTTDNLPTSLNIITDIKYIIRNFNSIDQLIYSNTEINSKIVELLLRASETAILNYDNESDELREKKKILDNINKYSKQICLALDEREEMYVGSLVGSFSVQNDNSLRTQDSYVEIPTCSSDLYKKCIKQKTKVMYNDSFFQEVLSTKSQFCIVGIHFYDDLFTQVYGSKGVKLKRHSSIYGYRVLKINNMKELLTSEEANEFSSSLNVIEIPLESKSENIYECRYWHDTRGWSNESCKFLGIENKELSNYVKCECPVFKFYGIFSADYQIPLDSFASETAQNSIVYDKQKNQLNNSSKILSQRSLNDVYVAFSITGNSADLYDQNLETLENSLSQQLTEKIESLSAIMKGLKIILNEPVYITLHLIQTTNITTDEPIQILAKKLSDRSLILYDLHRSRLNVPEQPLRIVQPRDKEVNDMGKPIAMFFAIFVSFLACFVFGSILIKRHQIVTEVSDTQQNVNRNDPMKRPKYKQLESTELIEQHSSCEQRYRHFSTNVELSDSGITLHSDRTQINLLQKLH
ncbi:uncharacterized protein LOC126841823 isoform X2 [Adelges cooleyi]|uniref:uncharacterized protein LOC126841823 isoform X2 n=1 Tax=Adelges cooleyi TaxID=133065 RepID=UPI0021803F52|nr:uncharacterized protein LOC126841823 isoform X2 [Adelges cooleyi]